MLKKFLRKLLKLDDMEMSVKQMDKTLQDNKSYLKMELQEQDRRLEKLEKTVKATTHFGASISPHKGESWAVVCIEGTHSVVKFIDLRNEDYVSILKFLEQYAGCDKVVDAPYEFLDIQRRGGRW